MKRYILYSIIALVLTNCTKENIQSNQETPFSLIPSSHSQIDFKNDITESLAFNFINYAYIYNGGGVAIGDINNDGFEDIYFSSNQNSNKLYLNLEEFKFKDITNTAKVEDQEGWSTGVSMIDINNDGWLDIYVCKSGSLHNADLRKNKLFINQKDNTFKEEAATYGLDHSGFSTQAYFFDFDKDGDLDMYLVNHRIDFHNSAIIDLKDEIIKNETSDQLFRNDNGIYTNVSKQAGIQNNTWGLSASIGDFNNDSWPDIFVANDFLQPDFLYINNKNGTFTDQNLDFFRHTSFNSMGSDFADINNDLLPDLIVLDMLAEDRIRAKENMASMNTQKFNEVVEKGYNHQYMSNVLQLNNGENSFSEIGQLAQIAKTDWSWAPLIADFDNDGLNDLFVTNGIKHDMTNQDFRHTMSKNLKNKTRINLNEVIDLMPSATLANYMFKNNGDYTFKDVSKSSGLADKINSNGVAYADMDNDGDLDLVINNQSMQASIYKNNTSDNYIAFSFEGAQANKNGIGAKVKLYHGNNQQLKVNYTNRGFQSSVSNKLIFGLGKDTQVDSLILYWKSNVIEKRYTIKANEHVTFNYNDAKKVSTTKTNATSIFDKINLSKIGVTYQHKAVQFDDYAIQTLLPQKQSTIDSAIAIVDVNNDGLDDIFLGNTQGFAAQLYIQQKNGSFISTNETLFKNDKSFNDNNALFFDCDNDKDLDLYIATGNYALREGSQFLQDRLYINDGNGNFTKSNKLPKMLTVTKAIAANDFDNDGDLDLFIGGRVISQKYPVAPPSYLLENRNGTFYNITSSHLSGNGNLGLVNDAIFSDYDKDGDKDLLVVGEWMPITLFKNDNGFFTKIKSKSDDLTGWFQTISAIDFDNDGDDDYFLGNYGNNNKFQPSSEKPLHIYANYFDENTSFDIALSKETKGIIYPVRGKECSSVQTPFINKKITSYKDFANASIYDVYGKDKIDSALHLKATTFSSFYVENKQGHLDFKKLPNTAQFGPILEFEFLDVDNDGRQEVIGTGNIYESEIETVRYDASNTIILTKDNNGSLLVDKSLPLGKNTRCIKKIRINNKPHLIFLNADDNLTLLKLK